MRRWILARKSESTLAVFEKEVLKGIFSRMKENNTWRIRYNNELYKQLEESSTSNVFN
jgi:hypothetical protein